MTSFCSEVQLAVHERSFISLWALIKMCNMLFIYRMVRFLPASKNIRIIVGTVIDEIRNGGAFFGVLFVRATTHSAHLYTWLLLLLELLLCLFAFRNGIIRWSNRSALRSLQLVECHVRSALPRIIWKKCVCSCRICGTYEQLEYWPNSFDDFYVSDDPQEIHVRESGCASLMSSQQPEKLKKVTSCFDFKASMVTLYNIMVVNQWFVFVIAYRKATSTR